MRRQDIQLRALARQGDTAACCEIGRRYLLGVEGFTRHVPSGLEYLDRPGVAESRAADAIVAECLPLQELLSLDRLAHLTRAAQAGVAGAQLKLALWCALRRPDVAEPSRWLAAARASGHRAAAVVGEWLDDRTRSAGLLRSPALVGDLDIGVVATMALREAVDARDADALAHCLRMASDLTPVVTDELAELTARAVGLAEHGGLTLEGVEPQALETCLDIRARRGDADAAFALGRALCGIDVGRVDCESLTATVNMRRGVATLFRAADAGCSEAWLHLYRAHADHRLSVANSQMARFCLEKAAHGGQVEAQRKLGALMLRDSESLTDSEQAIEWLHRAATADDAHAEGLLQSLVLPLEGTDDQSADAVAMVRSDDPWLALRLQLSREYGLTRLEALCIDPALALRPWGIVVGKNRFIVQSRLAAGRAVPAVSPQASEVARHAAAAFAHDSVDARALEGDLRKRSLRQRRAFERHALVPSMFFATASSTRLEALRSGAKWAFAAREPLQQALAA